MPGPQRGYRAAPFAASVGPTRRPTSAMVRRDPVHAYVTPNRVTVERAIANRSRVAPTKTTRHERPAETFALMALR